jgi:RNA polymerase sigma factor (sigma-70 family)
MINSRSMIQNNEAVGEFLKALKNDKRQYKTLTKSEERSMIDKYLAEDNEDELRKLLVMHNIRLVFSIAKKYCKDTRDFDNMMAKGLYGLVVAANRFNLFECVTVKVQTGERPVMEKDSSEQKIDPVTGEPVFEPVFEKRVSINPLTCKPDYIKFSTYANPWIFKYVVDEFEHRSILIDNNSISIDDDVKIRNSTDNNQTMENYIDGMLSPEYSKPATVLENISNKEAEEFYANLGEYVKTTNELTAIEKQIIVDTFYNKKKVREISEEISMNPQSVLLYKKTALEKIKNHIQKNFDVNSHYDLEFS